MVGRCCCCGCFRRRLLLCTLLPRSCQPYSNAFAASQVDRLTKEGREECIQQAGEAAQAAFCVGFWHLVAQQLPEVCVLV